MNCFFAASFAVVAVASCSCVPLVFNTHTHIHTYVYVNIKLYRHGRLKEQYVDVINMQIDTSRCGSARLAAKEAQRGATGVCMLRQLLP